MVISSSISHRIDPLRFCTARADDRHDSIAKKAYFRAMGRAFEPGHELEDWLAAEAEVDRERIVSRAALTDGNPSSGSEE